MLIELLLTMVRWEGCVRGSLNAMGVCGASASQGARGGLGIGGREYTGCLDLKADFKTFVPVSDDVDVFDLWPVVLLGVSYRFLATSGDRSRWIWALVPFGETP